MIEPVTLLQLVGGTRLVLTRDAVKNTLARLLPGVTVMAHPGKVDINDFVEKAIVPAPGVAVGYTRLRQAADPGGTWSDVVDFVAYVVVDGGLVDRGPPVRTYDRELVAHAIGGQILRILRDPDLCFWGLTDVEPPLMDPGPNLTPVFTMKAEQNMTAVYAVTWSQALANDGDPWFDGPTPAVHGLFGPEAGVSDGIPADVADDDEVMFDLPPGDEDSYPPEILAYVRRGGPLPGDGGPDRGAGP